MKKFLTILYIVCTLLTANAAEPREGFSSNEISEKILARIDGRSYKEGCTVPLSELRYLTILHYNFKGQITRGELICNRAISDDLLEIFGALFDAKYQIERVELIDNFGADDRRSMIANNSSAFNFRYISGSKTLSNHSYGMAIDINPLYNPYVRGKMVDPIESTPYADRTKPFAHKIDKNDLCYKEFTKRGFTWGGDWKSLKDYQHFEKR